MRYLFIFSLIILTAISCKKDNEFPMSIPSNNLFNQVVENRIQTFTFPANSGVVCQDSQDGVEICVNTDCFTLNGNAVTDGNISLDYIEIFDKGSMVITNKTTMDAGTGEMLISGGEFYAKAHLDGSPLSMDSNCSAFGTLTIDPSFTGESNLDMAVWYGSIDIKGNLNWSPVIGDLANQTQDTLPAFQTILTESGGIEFDMNEYLVTLWGAEWNNCDVFVNWPDPKTNIKVYVPSGYDHSNSQIFMLYSGIGTGVAYLIWNSSLQLSQYVSVDVTASPFVIGQFSGDPCDCFRSHGIPLDMQAHIIMVAEVGSNGYFSYAMESVTIEEDMVINFSSDDLEPITPPELQTLVNLLP